MAKIVIVGASIAGLSAARSARAHGRDIAPAGSAASQAPGA
ncbi:hypothetical protein [Glacieibacterium sp.]